MNTKTYQYKSFSKDDRTIYTPILNALPYDENLQALFEFFKRDARRQQRNNERHLDGRELSDLLLQKEGTRNEQHDMSEQALLEIEKGRLRAALMQLSPVACRRITLCFFRGMSHEEIGQSEGVSKQAVTKSIHLGLENLKKLLE